MKYRYRLWCGDCCGEDPQGCFDGDTDLSLDVFDTYEEAEQAGFTSTNHCSLWEYCVTNEEGKEIKESEAPQ